MCEYMRRPGTGSSALSTVPVRDSLMKSVFLSAPPKAQLVVASPAQDLIR